MRIPPAVAIEVGTLFAASRTNEAAGRDLTAATSTLVAARASAASGDASSALADARTAVSLFEATLATPTLAPAATTSTRLALGITSDAIRRLETGSDATIAFDFAVPAAEQAAQQASEAAVLLRAQAEAISAPYLGGVVA